MTFPFRRLPFLTIVNVIQNIDVEDFINFIQMSTKMRTLVKLSKVHILLNVFSNARIGFEKLSDPGRNKQVEFFLKPNSMKKQKKISFEPFVCRKSMYRCEENFEEYRRIMDDFVDIFIVSSASFDMRSTPSDISVQCLEYALSLGLTFKKVQLLISKEHSMDCCQKVLSICARASELSIHLLDYSEEFYLLDRFREYKINVFELTITRNFEWFTVDHLLALINCTNVRIYDVNLSDADFNKFLKHWVTGVGKMETLCVGLESSEGREENLINADDVMDGIPRREILQDEKFEVEGPNGIKANVWCFGLRFSIGDIDLETLLN
ncbi:hypothetical protein CAEBREN_14897 [Caenorhabditis brenneri]|uniref:F-box domain-containing protein n=1 Tax=Caenorhabditis brenneri TaxID=135651 RepID=G0MFF9_CAEBE|nr:hypothetical protein CAEBREN_14897 [Caenorhabditis brenneri]